MKKILLLAYSLALLSCNNEDKITNSNTFGVPDQKLINEHKLEIEYLDKKSKYINELIDIEVLDELSIKKNNYALDTLEGFLHVLLSDALVDDFSKRGKINTSTLCREFGIDKMDGLVTKIQDTMTLFYTTKYLFDSYFKSDKYFNSICENCKIDSFENLSSKDLTNILTYAFQDDSRVFDFSSLKIKTSDGINAYGLLGLSSNGDWPLLPSEMYVLVTKGKYIYVAQITKKLIDKSFINVIPECIYIHDSLYSDLDDQKKLNNYRALADSSHHKRINKLYYDDFESYCECYKNNFPTHAEFKIIEKQFEKMVTFILNEMAK